MLLVVSFIVATVLCGCRVLLCAYERFECCSSMSLLSDSSLGTSTVTYVLLSYVVGFLSTGLRANWRCARIAAEEAVPTAFATVVGCASVVLHCFAACNLQTWHALHNQSMYVAWRVQQSAASFALHDGWCTLPAICLPRITGARHCDSIAGTLCQPGTGLSMQPDPACQNYLVVFFTVSMPEAPTNLLLQSLQR
jgi:hypothetical protein